MTLNERCMLVGLVVGGSGGFCEGLLNEQAWHARGHYGPEPDWFYGLIAMMIFGVIGSFFGAVIAEVVNKASKPQKEVSANAEDLTGTVWPPPPKA